MVDIIIQIIEVYIPEIYILKNNYTILSNSSTIFSTSRSPAL